MKNLFILILACFLSNANATIEDGNSFLEHLESGSTMRRQYVLGYVAGMYDSYERTDISLAECLGDRVKMGQIVDTISQYLRNNPQIRHEPLYYHYSVAIKSAFKCK